MDVVERGLTLDFLRRQAEHALSMSVRLARPGPVEPGGRLEPGDAPPGVASFSPDDVRAASRGRPWDIQTVSGRSGLMWQGGKERNMRWCESA